MAKEKGASPTEQIFSSLAAGILAPVAAFNAIKLAKMFDNNNFSEFNVCEFMNQKKIVFKTTSSLVNRKHIFSISVNGILVKKVNYSF